MHFAYSNVIFSALPAVHFPHANVTFELFEWDLLFNIEINFCLLGESLHFRVSKHFLPACSSPKPDYFKGG